MANGTQVAALPGERTILSSDNGVLHLTNYRVKFDAKVLGAAKYISISLDNISSCGLITVSNPVFLVIAAICSIVAIAVPDMVARLLLALVGIAFVVGYFATRSGVITVSSNGGEGISVPAKGMNREQILAFIEAVTEAKLRFVGKLSQ